MHNEMAHAMNWDAYHTVQRSLNLWPIDVNVANCGEWLVKMVCVVGGSWAAMPFHDAYAVREGGIRFEILSSSMAVSENNIHLSEFLMHAIPNVDVIMWIWAFAHPHPHIVAQYRALRVRACIGKWFVSKQARQQIKQFVPSH